MKRFLLGAALAALFVGAASAQTFNQFYTTVPVTRDIVVTRNATSDFVLPAGPALHVSIKNDCARVLYFDLQGGTTKAVSAGSTTFSLRLGSGETFSAPVRVWSIGVSEGSGGAAACTFTLVVGK